MKQLRAKSVLSERGNMYTVYEHRNKINGKKYIGITKRQPKERWGTNGCGYKSSPHFYSAIQKYGWDNFDHIILETGLTKEEACMRQKELIKEFNTQDNRFGYNVLEGGQASELPEEVKKKMSKAMMGNQNGAGHPCSEEKKRKISEAQKGRKLTKEHKKKLSDAAKKRHVPCSEDKKKKLSKSYPHKKKVFCKETKEIYDSVQECARQLNLHATSVSRVCRGLMHTTGGYHLQYYDDNTVNA